MWPPLQPRRSGHILANQGRRRTPHKSRKFSAIWRSTAHINEHYQFFYHAFFFFLVRCRKTPHSPNAWRRCTFASNMTSFSPECAVSFPPLHVEPEKSPGSLLACGRNRLAISIPVASALRGGWWPSPRFPSQFCQFHANVPQMQLEYGLPHQKSKFGTQIQTKILNKPFGRFSGYKFAGASRETNSKSTVHIGPARPITFNTFTPAATCTPLKQLNLNSIYTSQVPWCWANWMREIVAASNFRRLHSTAATSDEGRPFNWQMFVRLRNQYTLLIQRCRGYGEKWEHGWWRKTVHAKGKNDDNQASLPNDAEGMHIHPLSLEFWWWCC